MKLLALFCGLWCFLPEVLAAERYALLVGANDGGQARPALRYASKDAENLADVLQSLGNFSQTSVRTLRQPTRASLYAQLEDFASRMKPNAEFVFYYSGHADEQGLLLKNERVPYEVLREKLKSFPAKVKLFIIDACSSGALTYGKGGTRQEPFMIQTAQQTSGYAIMTSSSTDELSQESERLRSSFFTHFLVTGLRGAADADKDRLVTLNEAYQFAYQSTIQSTAKTQMGTQHPSYEFQLKGHGDLVLTNLRNPTSALDFPKDLQGQFYIRSPATRQFIELNKKPGAAEVLALEPGTYEIVRFAGSQYFLALVELGANQKIAIDQIKMDQVPAEKVAARGDFEFPQFYRQKFLHISPMPGSSFQQNKTDRYATYFHLSPLVGTVDRLNGLGLGLFGHMSQNVDGAAYAFGFTYNEGTFNGLQVSGGLNTTEELNGLQLGLINYSYQIRGGQIGLANVGGLIKGGQLGFFNIAESVEGLQIGLFNYTERSRGLSLAPIMIVLNGIVRAETWIDSLGTPYIGFRSGTPYYYSTGYVGGDGHITQLVGGFGLRLPIAAGALASDFSWSFYQRRIPSTTYVNTQGELIVYPKDPAIQKIRRIRVFSEWPLTSSLYLMVGLSQVTQQYGGSNQKRLPVFKPLTVEDEDTLHARTHWGYMFGFSYSLLEKYQ